MNFTMPDLLPAYAEIFLLVMVSVDPGRGPVPAASAQRGVTYVLSLLTLLGCAVLTVGRSQCDRRPGHLHLQQHVRRPT